MSQGPFSSLAEWKTGCFPNSPKAREQPLLELLPRHGNQLRLRVTGLRARSGDKDDAGAKWPELQGGGLSR